jgi:hypothetical protein
MIAKELSMKRHYFSMVVASILAFGAISQHVCQATPEDVSALIDALVEQRGEEYIAARSALLSLPDARLQDVIAELRSDRSDVMNRFLGSVLEVRSTHLELVQDFEERVQRTIATPMPTRSGRPMYSLSVQRDTEQALLLYEAALKYILPEGMREYVLDANVGHVSSYEHNVEPFLVILGSDVNFVLKSRTAITLAATAAKYPDDRVIPALVRLYKEARLSEPLPPLRLRFASVVASAFRFLPTIESLIAVEELLQFEREVATAEGWAPWDDLDAIALSREVGERMTEYAMAQERANPEIGRGNLGKPEPRPLTDDEVRAFEEAIEHAQNRRNARMAWEQLMKSRDELIRKLGKE